MSGFQNIDWRSIAVALIVSFIVAIVIGFCWGILGLMLFATSSESAVEAVLSPAGDIIGFLLSLIPLIVGSFYLQRSIDHSKQTHSIVFAVANMAIYLGFALATGDATFELYDILYFVAILPTVIISGHVASG